MGAMDAIGQKVGPFPLGVWLLAGGVGAVFAVKARQGGEPTVTKEVQQVAVPVGSIGAVDHAPLVMSPVVRINVPEIDKLTGAIRGNTTALGGNTKAVTGNTSATTGNTTALGKNTSALVTNTHETWRNTDAVIQNTGATSGLAGQVGGLTGAVAGLTGAIGNIPAPAAPAPAPAPAAAPQQRTYTVKSGDTLSHIAQRYTGNANNWPTLYQRNAGTIDSVARSRGKAGGGRWIFPGTTLVIPW